ncbi:hypothetical protein XENORESO_022073, partial [Xenotaenia resolanae]
DAVCTLNTLQTNASALEQVRRGRSHPQLQLQAMRGFLERAGLTVEQLDHLNIIHVTGTKGKGSTCAFTEQILRTYGFRTGFYRRVVYTLLDSEGTGQDPCHSSVRCIFSSVSHNKISPSGSC